MLLALNVAWDNRCMYSTDRYLIADSCSGKKPQSSPQKGFYVGFNSFSFSLNQDDCKGGVGCIVDVDVNLSKLFLVSCSQVAAAAAG
jgi:hypothetical protein